MITYITKMLRTINEIISYLSLLKICIPLVCINIFINRIILNTFRLFCINKHIIKTKKIKSNNKWLFLLKTYKYCLRLVNI